MKSVDWLKLKGHSSPSRFSFLSWLKLHLRSHRNRKKHFRTRGETRTKRGKNKCDSLCLFSLFMHVSCVEESSKMLHVQHEWTEIKVLLRHSAFSVFRWKERWKGKEGEGGGKETVRWEGCHWIPQTGPLISNHLVKNIVFRHHQPTDQTKKTGNVKVESSCVKSSL